MADVLVVVDMQNDFIDGSLGTKEAVGIVGNVVEEIKGDYDLIVCTRDTHGEDYLETNEGRHLPVVHCVEYSEGWELRKEVSDALEERSFVRILDKPNFGSYQLVDMLKEYDADRKIDSITLIGLCTDICVVNNALLLKTAFPEIKIAVKKDCCAGVTPESHDAALMTMKMCQIEIE
ncbi:MAG: cysteine hydrolase [Erysipelotrichaceae bacterium]|nr:cysteine hydrolase [Erysipelotrichaceae bacterium]